MKAEHDPLALHIFVSRRHCRNVNDTKSGKRREMTARLSFDTGLRAWLSRQPRRMGAPHGNSCEAVNDLNYRSPRSAETANSCVILSSSRNAVSISSDRTTNLLPSSRCASTIHSVRPSESTAAVRRFYWENLARSWRRKPIVISAIPRRPHQRTNHECQIGRPETLMRCAKNLIISITAPMNDKINPQIFSVFGVNMHIGTTSNYNSCRKSRL